MAEAIRLAKEGAILLVKAMGGYQLVCRGDRKETVGCLRRMKHRSGKPFALMMKDIDMAKAWAMLSEKEIEMLTSPVRPILLASPRRKVLPAVASRVPRLGLCLPSTGFYSRLAEGVDAPLIVTSANQSGEPMIFRDEEARAYYEAEEDIAGLFFYDREILRPADDSVMQLQGREVQILRRTRGFLPEPVVRDAPSGMVLATGADMAPGFALAGGGSLYPAEVPCDILNERSQAFFWKRSRTGKSSWGFRRKRSFPICILPTCPAFWEKKQPERGGFPFIPYSIITPMRSLSWRSIICKRRPLPSSLTAQAMGRTGPSGAERSFSAKGRPCSAWDTLRRFP